MYGFIAYEAHQGACLSVGQDRLKGLIIDKTHPKKFRSIKLSLLLIKQH